MLKIRIKIDNDVNHIINFVLTFFLTKTIKYLLSPYIHFSFLIINYD